MRERNRRPNRRVGIWMAVLVMAACVSEVSLETRTYELKYLDDDVAADLIRPYVYFEREGATGTMTVTEGKLTVRETAENLERIEAALAEFDTPKPGVRLTFQLIEADGFEGTDPEIREVEAALRELFRFEGYRLVGTALVNGMEGSYLRQDVPSDDPGVVYHLQTGIADVRTDADGGSIVLQVELEAWDNALLVTTVRVRAGQTAVLGSAAMRTEGAEGRTLILAVRPELVSME